MRAHVRLAVGVTVVALGLTVTPAAVAPDSTAVHASTPASVACTGTGSLLESGLQSVGGATLINHTPVATGGPNLVLNGDFTFTADDTDMSVPGMSAGLVPGTTAGGTPVAIRDWTAYGGGERTYAKWGYRVHGGEPAPAPANDSMVYFGNALGATWVQDSGASAFAQDGFINPLTFNAEGAALSNITVTPRDNRADYFGTSATPVTLTQTVAGLTPGSRYRLQFWMTGEWRATNPNQYRDPGLFGLDITGYHRVWVVVPSQSAYFTIDFVATSINTQLAFNVWGHTNPITSGTAPTELILDDVILAQCTDAGGLSAPATPVTALGQNPPWTVDDPYYTPFETSMVDGDVRLRDYVPVGAAVTKLTDPANGTLTWNGDGTYTYMPAPGFTGIDSFTYEVCSIFCRTGTQRIKVGQPFPMTVDDSYTTPLDTPITTGDASRGDSHVSGLTFTKLNDPSNGTVAWNPDGSFSYTPASGFTGTDSFDYQVCMPQPAGMSDSRLNPRYLYDRQTISDIYSYPDLTADSADIVIPTNGGVNAAWFVLTPATSGTLTLSTFDSNYDTIIWLMDSTGTQLARDDDAFNGPPWTSQLSHSVTAGQTYLVAVGGYRLNGWQYSVAPDSVLEITASEVDLMGCSTSRQFITVTGASTPNPNPPAPNPPAPNPPAEPPVALVTLTYDGNGGTCMAPSVTIPAGSVVSVDDASTCTRENFDFAGWNTAADGTGAPFAPGASYTLTASSTLYATWIPRPVTPPIARDDVETTPVNTPVSASVAGNDTYPAGSSFSKVSDPSNGRAVVNPDGSYTYTPAKDFVGVDSFKYRVCLPAPDTSVCVRATATITVSADGTPVTPPIARDDSHRTRVNTSVSASVAGNDTYPAGSSFSKVSDPSNGRVVVNPDGSYTYTPAKDFVGVDSFKYRVCLPAPDTSVCVRATATITVSAVGAPVAKPLIKRVPSGSVAPLMFSPKSTIESGSVLIAQRGTGEWGRKVKVKGKGVWVVKGDQVKFKPAAGFLGRSTIRYRVIDADGQVAYSTFTAVASAKPGSVDSGQI